MAKIVIADDNVQNLYMLATVLQNQGFEVLAARNGAEALSLALDNFPDAIITDILMPEMDGFELCRRCKSHESLCAVPFVFYTATYTDVKDEEFGLSLGADRFIIKPQEPAALVSAIREVMNRARLEKKLPQQTIKDENKELQEYNEVLFRKLEKKVADLEEEICKQQQTERELRESERKYHNLITQSPDGIFIVDLQGTFLAANKAMCEKLKYGEEELLSMKIWDIVPEKYLDLHKMRIAEILQGRAPEEAAEYMVHSKDGTLYCIEVRSSPYYVDNRLVGLHAIARDITERKKAEDEMRFMNVLLTTQNEASIDGILVVDGDGKMISHNKTFLDIWELPREIAESRSDKIALDYVLTKIADPDGFIKPVDYLYEHRAERSHDEVPMKDGRVLERFSAPMFGADGHYYGRVWYFHDITDRKRYEGELINSFQRVKKTLNDAINTMVKIGEMRDPYTAGHQQRVAILAVALAREIKLDQERVENLRTAAIIHDIGKMYVPSDILSKPGKLSTGEFNIIKTHPQSGYEIVKGIDFPPGVAETVLQHHERLDGSGYPQGLKGEDICLEARILAVADVVEAMASHRPYRPSLGSEKALKEISGNSGILYDAEVVNACVTLFNEKGFKFEDQ